MILPLLAFAGLVAAIIAIVMYFKHKGSTKTCTPACVLPQVCVGGVCGVPTYKKEVNQNPKSGSPGCVVPDTAAPGFNWSVTSGPPDGPGLITKCTSTPSCIGYYSGSSAIPWLIGTDTDPASCTTPLNVSGYTDFYRKVVS